MKSKLISGSLGAAALLSIAFSASAQVPTSAAVNASGSVNVTNTANIKTNVRANASASGTNKDHSSNTSGQDRMQKGEDRGDTAINARITALGKVSARINSMKNLSDAQKAAFVAEIQATVTDLNNLLTKIQGDTSTTTLRADLQTIAPNFRIYMLIVPQLSLLSAVDRVNTVVSSLQTIQTKIQSRISGTASLSGNATITADLADMTAKLSDATAQATAAQNEITNLKPDQGSASVQASNTAALKDARAKIQVSSNDLAAARKDAGAIVSLITAAGKGTNASASGSASTTVTP